MARVKKPGEASEYTVQSKNQRWGRLSTLFGIKRLSELFPDNATPNGADNDHLQCSGDVLRDLCAIGEQLHDRHMTQEQMRSRVKRSFTAGIRVRHQGIRKLLMKVKGNGALKTAIEAGYNGDFVAGQQYNVKQIGTAAAAALATTNNAAESGQYLYPYLYIAGYDGPQDEALETGSGQEGNAIDSQITKLQEDDEPIHVSVEDETKEVDATDPILKDFSIFDEEAPKGPRKAKVRASIGLTGAAEIEESEDEQYASGVESKVEYEDDDIIPAHATTKVINSKFLTSHLGHIANVQRQKLVKRKSAAGALEMDRKRRRTSATPSSPIYKQSEHATLVSCLKMSHSLLDGIDAAIDDGDSDEAQKKVGIVRGMVGSVLAKYSED